MIKNYTKNLFKVLLIPIFLYLGQSIIELIFIAQFNLKEVHILKFFYPYLSQQEIDSKLINLTKTSDYQMRLSNYMNEHIIIILLISMIIILPIAYYVYKRTNKIEKHESKSYYGLLMLPIFYNSLIYCLHINPVAYQPNELSYVKQIIASAIYGPIIEELVFRGLVFNKLMKFNQDNQAIIIATIIFALMHSGLYNIIYATIIGYFLTLNYYKHGSIKRNIILHGLCNLIVIGLIPILTLDYYFLNFTIIMISGALICIFIKQNKFV